jgi:hypothetical protein
LLNKIVSRIPEFHSWISRPVHALKLAATAEMLATKRRRAGQCFVYHTSNSVSAGMTKHMNDGERKGMDNQSRGGRGRRGQSTRDAGQEYLDAQRETLFPEIMGLMEQVNDSSIALPQRFELASRAMAKLTGIFLLEALAPVADAKRSVILSRLSIHLKATIDTLSRKKEVEASDTFNPSSPKLQACLSWFLDIFHEAVTAEVEPITRNLVFNHFATAVVDWEEKFERHWKGFEGHAPPQNPFMRARG